MELRRKLKITYHDDSFLHYDNGGHKKRFLIFSTTKNLNHLTLCKIWLCDDTFKSVPKGFYQLYTIHGYTNEKSIPMIYCLAPNESQTIYLNFLKKIRQSLPNFSPTRVLTDFAILFIEAFKEVLSGVKFSGCFFHFSQCIWYHIQSCRLRKSYNTDVTFAVNVRQLMALAFVPVDNVISTYESIVSSDYYDLNSDIFEDLLTYFETTWIGKLHHNKKETGETIIATIGSFIYKIKDEQSKSEMLMAQINTGLGVATSRPKAYLDYNN